MHEFCADIKLLEIILKKLRTNTLNIMVPMHNSLVTLHCFSY